MNRKRFVYLFKQLRSCYFWTFTFLSLLALLNKTSVNICKHFFEDNCFVRIHFSKCNYQTKGDAHF